MEIHVYRGTESLGAFTREETTQYLSEGRLLGTDMVWYAGLEDWKQLSEVSNQLTSLESAAEYDVTQTVPPETHFIGKSSSVETGGIGKERKDPGLRE